MQNPNSHNSLDRLLHDTYLGNQSLAEISFDIENLLFGNSTPSAENIVVTGLARSGTTSVFNYLYNTNEFASLLYSDMPFLLMPNIWNLLPKKKSIEKTERFHGDNILVGKDSPEALDEFFWKVFLKNSYITNETMEINTITKEIAKKYEQYISLICRARKKEKYLSKNNNSILRIQQLQQLTSPTKIILLYRKPLEHAASLLKLHNKFSGLQQDNKFILRYFDYLGHHEFGLHQKSFNLHPNDKESNSSSMIETIDYWIKRWIDYYGYVLNNFSDEISLICFEDVCKTPDKTYDFISEITGVKNKQTMPAAYEPPRYIISENNNLPLIEKATELYEQLNNKRKYI